MRVITGSARGMKLATLDGEHTRPTREAVKEAVFSMIQFEIEGARVLDLFAGSGQMGIEALSRGAQSCVFCDNSSAAAKVIKQNLTHTKLADKATLVCADFSQAVRRGTFDIAFVDPPYSMGLIDKVLPPLTERMSDGGVIICESDAHDVLPDEVGGFKKTVTKKYTRNIITLYRHI